MYELSRERNHDSHRRLLLVFLIQTVWYQEEKTSAQIPYSKARTQKGNRPGAPQRTSAHTPYYKCVKVDWKYTRISTEDICLDYLLQEYETSEEINKELHRRLMLIFIIKSL